MATAPAGWIRIVTVDVDAAVAFLPGQPSWHTQVIRRCISEAWGNGVIGRCGGWSSSLAVVAAVRELDADDGLAEPRIDCDLAVVALGDDAA